MRGKKKIKREDKKTSKTKEELTINTFVLDFNFLNFFILIFVLCSCRVLGARVCVCVCVFEGGLLWGASKPQGFALLPVKRERFSLISHNRQFSSLR